MPLRFASLLVCLSIFASTLYAQTTKVPDKRSAVPADINNKFTDPNVDADEWAKRFEGESRQPGAVLTRNLVSKMVGANKMFRRPVQVTAISELQIRWKRGEELAGRRVR